MRCSPGSLLLLLLVVSCLSPAHGVLESHYTNLKCKCLRVVSTFISLQNIERIEAFPPGNGCPNIEIIIWKKKGNAVCLNPHAKWTKKLLTDAKNFQKKKIPPTMRSSVSSRRTS